MMLLHLFGGGVEDPPMIGESGCRSTDRPGCVINRSSA